MVNVKCSFILRKRGLTPVAGLWVCAGMGVMARKRFFVGAFSADHYIPYRFNDGHRYGLFLVVWRNAKS